MRLAHGFLHYASPRMISIAVDAMGGDGGLSVSMAASRRALDHIPDLALILVGDSVAIHASMSEWPDALRSRISVVDASTVLAADVSPAHAIRSGQTSSMAVAISQIKSQQAQAVVSSGSTVGLMALSRHLLGMRPGVERPALMTQLPTQAEPVWVLDLGANVGVDAQRLLEFAQLGTEALLALNKHHPKVALLNIGSEPRKGPDVIREAARLIEAETDLNYCGFIEADQVFQGGIDLVVCDGFAGNVLLKSAEGAVRLVMKAFSGPEVSRGYRKWIHFFTRSRLRQVYETLDPSLHNGAPLLGVEGLVIKSHGGSSAKGLVHAIELAFREATTEAKVKDPTVGEQVNE